MTTENASQVRCTSLGRKSRFSTILEIGAIYTVVNVYPEIRQGAFVQRSEIMLRKESGEEGRFPADLFEPVR